MTKVSFSSLQLKLLRDELYCSGPVKFAESLRAAPQMTPLHFASQPSDPFPEISNPIHNQSTHPHAYSTMVLHPSKDGTRY